MDGGFASSRVQDPLSQKVRFGEMIREGVDSRKSCFRGHGAMAVTNGRKNVMVDTRRARIGSIIDAGSSFQRLQTNAALERFSGGKLLSYEGFS
jgi:hypothetical protein